MTDEKAIQEAANQFMARTNLHEASWKDKIEAELVEVLRMVYGAGYDYGRDEILFHRAKEVLQLGEYGNVVATYKSVSQAARAVGGDVSNIRAVLNSRQHTAYGYGWRYVDSFFDYNKDLIDEENISDSEGPEI